MKIEAEVLMCMRMRNNFLIKIKICNVQNLVKIGIVEKKLNNKLNTIFFVHS